MTRSAIVTGGSAGIGLAIAAALSGEGYGVTIVGRNPDRLQSALSALNGSAQELSCDVGDADAAARIVARHRSRFGGLDVLVNNAGLEVELPLHEQSDADLERQLNVNLRAACLLSRDCIPLLCAAGNASGNALLVNIASIAAKLGRGDSAVYSAAKAGMVGLSQALHHEVSRSNVQVSAICPEFVDTQWTSGATVPAGDMIRPDDVAEAVLFLLRIGHSCHIPEIQIARRGGPLL